jgi:hypothetical protein
MILEGLRVGSTPGRRPGGGSNCERQIVRRRQAGRYLPDQKGASGRVENRCASKR